MPKQITGMDIVWVEHDLVCKAIDMMEIAFDEELRFNEKYTLGFIEGVSRMAKALKEILAEGEDGDTGSD